MYPPTACNLCLLYKVTIFRPRLRLHFAHPDSSHTIQFSKTLPSNTKQQCQTPTPQLHFSFVVCMICACRKLIPNRDFIGPEMVLYCGFEFGKTGFGNGDEHSVASVVRGIVIVF